MIEENLHTVETKIAMACLRAGRLKEDITLIAVSKTKPISMVEEASKCGVVDFGENKVQEILTKFDAHPELKWHMIGHLQRNKVKSLIDKVTLIHSVDSIRLAKQIEEDARAQNYNVDILLEVNIAKEESKYGFMIEEIESAIEIIRKLPHVHIKGLMTIAPFVDNPEENRQHFRKLNQLYVDMKTKSIDNVAMNVLSMGMSGDFEIAIEEGATMIRVGTGIFGTR